MPGKPVVQHVPHAAPTEINVLNILEARAQESHHELAGSTEAGGDVLAYLALHGETATRKAVASNIATPAEANLLLADDVEEEVRCELARKIARLMPGLSAQESDHVVGLTIATLEKLARDQEARVRAILAEEIKHLHCVPKDIVQLLAHDLKIAVAGPILEYSPLLSDADLIEIIARGCASEAVEAIARRSPVSEDVSDAVVTALDIPGIAALLTNSDAKIRREAMEKITEQAEAISQWHMPLTLRFDLSGRVLRRIATFVGSGLLDKLTAHSGLDEETRLYLKKQLQTRLQVTDNSVRASNTTQAATIVQEAKQNGRLNEAFIETQAELGAREVVILALAELSRVPADTVRRMLLAGTAKPITSLVWYAGLNMRAAFKIQSFVMKLTSRDLLPARGGVDFPLSESEMRWHLGYFDIVV